MWSMVMPALERHALTIKLAMYLSVKKLETFMFVMTHAGKLYRILQMVCWCALFQATVLIVCCCHQMKWNQMWTNNKLVRQTKQNCSWARVFLLEPIYWDITAMMRRN